MTPLGGARRELGRGRAGRRAPGSQSGRLPGGTRVAIGATVVFAALLAPVAFALPAPEPRPIELEEAVGEMLVVEGTINLYGNVPHTFLGLLAAPDGELEVVGGEPRAVAADDALLFRLQGKLTPELERLQGRRVVARGELLGAGAPPALPAVLRVMSYEAIEETE
ncbi:MAG: hypothetical protein ACOC1U_04860 [Spirochaetota bacterium]